MAPGRDSGRPCGCDPAAGHPCEAHARARDLSETEVGIVTGSNDDPDIGSVDPVTSVLVVSGPDSDGEIMILGSRTIWMSRFQVEDLINELRRRLEIRSE
jgi:hypothetical protein